MAGPRVAIFGLGLIGASLGLALKQHSDTTVVGFDPSRETADRATSRKAVDRAAGSPIEAVRGADTVVLAAPVRAIMDLLSELRGDLSERVLVTDTGSTKAAVAAHAARVLPTGVAFVGGHPLAGRLRSRVDDADAGLFVGATYCLCPALGVAEWGIQRAIQLVESVGAVPHFLQPDEHDALLAAVSHLPYFASAALMRAVAEQSAWPEMATLAAGGFRTITSLVDASPRMWTDIALTNAGPVERQLDGMIETLEHLRAAIRSGDTSALQASLEEAHRLHRDWVEAQDSPTAAPATTTKPRRRFPFPRGGRG